MSLANVSIDDRGRNAFEIRMSFDGDDDYPTGGTPAFKAVLRDAIVAAAAIAPDANVRGAESVDIIDVVPGNCGAYQPSYDLATDRLLVMGHGTPPAVVGPGTDVPPYDLEPADHIDLDVGAGGIACTFDAAAAEIDDTSAYPVIAGAGTLTVRINRGTPQVITFAGTEVAAADIAQTINAQIVGARATVTGGGQVRITTDRRGEGAYVQVTELPAVNPALVFDPAEVQGTGDVADIDAVTAAEAEAVIEADMTGDVIVTYDALGRMVITTVATGLAAEIQVEGTSTCDFGLDGNPHTGSDALQAIEIVQGTDLSGTRFNLTALCK
jgi:hypothetical protein